MSKSIHTEVLVLGGGPAGATIARNLALKGHQVLLIEKQAFPRQHVGECLSQSILPLLERLDLKMAFQRAPFVHQVEAVLHFQSDSQIAPETNNGITPAAKQYFAVDRGFLDKLLLENAKRAGVRVLQPATLTGLRAHAEKFKATINDNGHKFEVTAAFLVDATGRTSNLVSKERYFTHRSSALYAYWEPTKRVCRKRMIVEFTANEWYWGCDLPNGSFNAMCFVEPSVLINKNEDERARLYDRLLKESKLLPQLVSRKIGKVHCCDASSSVSRVPIANNFIKVGEAAICIDPVSGQGLHFAILSGIQGAIVCHTILSDSSKRTAAMQFYQSQLNHWERIHTGLVPSFSRTRPEDFLSSTIDFRVKVKEEEEEEEEEEGGKDRDELTDANNPNGLPQLLFSDSFEWSPELRIEPLPCVLNDSIEILPTLTHPRLGQGIAFINGLSVTNFIQLASPYTFPCLLDNWSKLLGDDVQARNLILKFLNMNLLKKIVS